MKFSEKGLNTGSYCTYTLSPLIPGCDSHRAMGAWAVPIPSDIPLLPSDKRARGSRSGGRGPQIPCRI